MSYQELVNCQIYAERVLSFYKKCNKGETPKSASEAEMIVREYNKEWTPFKRIFGYSIRGYVPTIVDNIGFMVEQ